MHIYSMSSAYTDPSTSSTGETACPEGCASCA